MSWQKAKFNGKDVWVEVSSEGTLKAERGRVGMRYSNKSGAKIYRGGAAKITLLPGAPIELPEGGGGSKGKSSGFGKAGTRTKSQAAAAKVDAAKKLAALADDVTVVYTDGGCRGNPGPAGSGVVVHFADGRKVEAARSLGRGTNNIAELTAIEIALDLLDEAELPADAPVTMFSDSSYANGVLVKGWKAKKNVELIQGIRAKLKKRPRVEVVWVAGHAGIAGNERADELATAGVQGRTSVDWS